MLTPNATPTSTKNLKVLLKPRKYYLTGWHYASKDKNVQEGYRQTLLITRKARKQYRHQKMPMREIKTIAIKDKGQIGRNSGEEL